MGEVQYLFSCSDVLKSNLHISSTALKLPNGVFAGNTLPTNLEGANQKPDFLWPIHHTFMGTQWSLASTTTKRMWSYCIGEGKPLEVPEEGSNDHALNQVVMSATASIYHQIAMKRENPRVLVFTLNKSLIRFFIVIGERKINTEDLWDVKYFHVIDRNLDLSISGDCVRAKTLAKVLKSTKNEREIEFGELVQNMGSSEMTVWWVEAKKRNQPTTDKGGKGSLDGAPDPNPGRGEEGGGDDGGRGGKRRKGGQDSSEKQSLAKGKISQALLGREKTLALVMALKHLSVNIPIILELMLY
jgi:hypothetical protein